MGVPYLLCSPLEYPDLTEFWSSTPKLMEELARDMLGKCLLPVTRGVGASFAPPD